MSRQIAQIQPLLSSAARTENGQSSFYKVGSASSIRIFIGLTVITAGSLQVYVEGSPDNSTPYILKSFQPLAAVRSEENSDLYTEVVVAPPKYVRIRYVISGGGTITFSADMNRIEQG